MIVHTESGSRYEFDLEANTVRRVRGDSPSELRKDDEVCALLRIPAPPVVGQVFGFFLDVRGDGIETLRTTTLVTKVEP